jgi:carbon monoxide dehydrogenase subunit G
MKRVERTATIAASPETLFAYLADLGNLGEWMPGIVSAEVTSPGEIGVGTIAHVVRALGSQRVSALLTVAEYDAPRNLVITSEVSGVRVTAALGLEPVAGEATDLHFAMEIRGSMLTSFMEPMIAGAAGGEIDATLERLRARFGPLDGG